MVRTRFRSAVSFCAAVVLSAGAASAGPLTEWNLIVAGNLASTSEVDGSALIGGSILSGASNYGVQGITSSTGDALLIGGNVSVGVTLNVNNGTTRLGGVNNGTINPNGGPLINDPGRQLSLLVLFRRCRASARICGRWLPTARLTVLAT